ncbi:hypothetical protein [Streptomyces sp. NPDC049555]|uniref:hypothetical protein n=1 Tax=Streptomyces sp. NPDC049555 TaxID=3154930 RepID=UPI00343D0572
MGVRLPLLLVGLAPPLVAGAGTGRCVGGTERGAGTVRRTVGLGVGAGVGVAVTRTGDGDDDGNGNGTYRTPSCGGTLPPGPASPAAT